MMTTASSAWKTLGKFNWPVSAALIGALLAFSAPITAAIVKFAPEKRPVQYVERAEFVKVETEVTGLRGVLDEFKRDINNRLDKIDAKLDRK